jgi:hypothetical protein
VAIICNLDQVKPRKEALPRTRSQKDRISPELGDDDENPEIVVEKLEPADEIVVRTSPPPFSVSDDKDEDIVEIPRDTKDSVIVIQEEPKGEVNEPIDVDSSSQNAMQGSFEQLTLSDQNMDYDFRSDPSIDENTKKAMIAATSEPVRRYTRHDTTVLQDSPIDIDDEPETITSRLRRKINTFAPVELPSTPVSRRVSGKVIPLNRYSSFFHPLTQPCYHCLRFAWSKACTHH